MRRSRLYALLSISAWPLCAPIGGCARHADTFAPTDESDCYELKALDAIPERYEGFPEPPLSFIEMAEGTWTGANPEDVLTVRLARTAVESRWICEGYDQIPQPAGPGPHVSFIVNGKVTLHTADGQWRETLNAAFTLQVSFADKGLSAALTGLGVIPLSALQGSFTLPADTAGEAVGVVLLLEHRDQGWVLDRIAPRNNPGGGPVAPVWSGEQMRFDQRADGM